MIKGAIAGILIGIILSMVLSVITRILPLLISKIMLAVMCLGLSAYAFGIAPEELSSSGFAARNREPDDLAYFIAWVTCTLALLNLIIIFSSTKDKRLRWAYFVTAGVAALSVYLFFARF